MTQRSFGVLKRRTSGAATTVQESSDAEARAGMERIWEEALRSAKASQRRRLLGRFASTKPVSSFSAEV
ncbi:hypothetical protein ODZ83_08370 [Acaricomes phytoseiuli]|uniref:hypothetical protein n=1 Tax=Acaricomes phytoseiuli TaxID=291968 RepID=UPI0003713C81|nr:hypothetical protein [Acaricomes phytoseiuli]MCW1250192.1 hypothetical protein [Acaricomes phytoseiuli]